LNTIKEDKDTDKDGKQQKISGEADFNNRKDAVVIG
jgi:hypothetical protein